MVEGLRKHYVNVLTSLVHVGLLVIAVKINTPKSWMISLGLISAISFLAWIGNFRRARMIGDTPTSKIASAAQGYVELVGAADRRPGSFLVSRLSKLPCVWYRYLVERRTDNNKWAHEESGESDTPFMLRDGTGSCVIDPFHAEVIGIQRQWERDDYRYTEHLLFPEDKLYAIGQFSTVGGAGADLDIEQDLAQLLEQWKQNLPALIERFDANKDRKLDYKEWETARLHAQREVQERHRDIRHRDPLLVLHKPLDGRLFLISNLPPEALAKKYQAWALVHLLIFIGGAGGAAYVGLPLL
jgi:hypothetical protein